MKLIVFAAVAIILWAAFINISASVQPLNGTHVVSSVVLTLAVAIQRISGVQRWLSKPKMSRVKHVDDLARTTLIKLCKGKAVSNDVLDLAVHVWEVPLWYRRIFPYELRNQLRSVVEWRILRKLSTWTIRPRLRRLAAVGFTRLAPSGVKFRKGRGLIGVCIANNDRAEFMVLNTAISPYCDALASATEEDWKTRDDKVTHNLSLSDARKLSHSYGQVLAYVVQDENTGEAIGCVTISAKNNASRVLKLTTDPRFKEGAKELAFGVARVIV